MKLHDPDIDYRAHPERYRVGRGEQGVLTCEPYKGELLPHWRFKTAAEAAASAAKIRAMFDAYLDAEDYVGADMARKFLQMGYTRATRYARRKGGRKYAADGALLPEGTGDPEKARSAAVFKDAWKAAEAAPVYAAWRRDRRAASRG